MGKVADILQQRGDVDEALRLGDVRERATTMGKMADILQQQGEIDEALRILTEECLPAAVGMGDLDSIAHFRYSSAQVRLLRRGRGPDERQVILDELTESFALNNKLQRTDGVAVVGALLGQVLAAEGFGNETHAVLDQSAAAFERLGLTDEAAQVRALQERIRQESQEGPPEGSPSCAAS